MSLQKNVDPTIKDIDSRLNRAEPSRLVVTFCTRARAFYQRLYKLCLKPARPNLSVSGNHRGNQSDLRLDDVYGQNMINHDNIEYFGEFPPIYRDCVLCRAWFRYYFAGFSAATIQSRFRYRYVTHV